MYKHRTLMRKAKLICSQVVRKKKVLRNKSTTQARRKQAMCKANREGMSDEGQRDEVTVHI